MPAEVCPYCNTSVSSKRHLERHQKTAKYCIKIQRSQNITVDEDEFKCSCGKSFNLKHNLKTHQRICEPIQLRNTSHIETKEAVQDLLSETGFQLTNELMINLFMKQIEGELQVNKFYELLYRDYLELLDFVIAKCITNSDNYISIEIADISRKKIIIKKQSMTPEYDIGAYRIAGWIGDVFGSVLLSIYNNNGPDIDTAKVKFAMKNLKDDFKSEYLILRKHIINTCQKINMTSTPVLSEIETILENETSDYGTDSDTSLNLYIITSPLHEKANQFKVGIHTGNISKLIARYRTAIPELTIKLFIEFEENKAKEIENKIKETFSMSRIIGSGGNLSEFYEMPLNNLYRFIINPALISSSGKQEAK